MKKQHSNQMRILSTKSTQYLSKLYQYLDLPLRPNKKRYLFIACILLFFSFAVHLTYFHFNRTFSQDQARDILIAENYIENGQWLIGYGPKASVANFYLPPFYYYLQTVVHLISSWPLSMSIFITFIESFTPVILFLIFARWIDERTGVIAATVYTVSPLVLTFSTFMWNPNLIQFTVMVSLWATIEYVMTKKRFWILVTAMMLTIAFHLHYQSVVVFPFFVLVYLVMLWQRREDWKYYGAGILIFLLSFSTYLVVEMQASFQNTREIIRYFQTDHARIYEQVTKPQYIWLFIPQFFSRILMPNYLIGEGIRWGRVLFLIILPVTFMLSGIGILKKKPRAFDVARFLLCMYILSVVFMLRMYKGEKVDYYMSTLFMAPAILVGIGFSYIRKVALPLSMVFIVVYMSTMGKFYAHRFQVKYDNYNDLRAVFSYINSHVQGQETQLIFANEDFTNSVKFGEKKFATFPSFMSTSVSAPYVVQFCYSGETCAPLQDILCSTDKNVEKIGLRYDVKSVYNPQVAYIHGVYTIVISQRME